ncbi:hypothetical protein SAMN02746062_01781 [Alysiella filiformis DSM 16848]|uniref:Uncharacterized protein n=1 Tax=Alysiella filiformis DSM 16848 TaxID=1120981 RepID=A0A286EFR2_9NEIS|nr:hypothetical protein [Alysiella filiformis]SOD69654.1 hypothetical protein SAMN02746062_01781 [Alysiella filiformis DSM 16848]
MQRELGMATVNVPSNQPSLLLGKRWRKGLLNSFPSPQPSPKGRGGKMTSTYQSLLVAKGKNFDFVAHRKGCLNIRAAVFHGLGNGLGTRQINLLGNDFGFIRKLFGNG